MQGKRRRYLGLAACVGALCISPWAARNYLQLHRLIPIRDNFGVELKVGNQPGQKGLWDAKAHPASSAYELGRLAELGEAEYTKLSQQEAVQTIRSHPGEFVVNTIRRIGYFWMGTPRRSPRHLWFLKNVPLTVFSALAFCGAVGSWQRRNRNELLFAVVLLFYPTVFYLTHIYSLSYMYPIQPEMMALATSAVCGNAWVAMKVGPRSDGNFLQRAVDLQDYSRRFRSGFSKS